MSEYWVSHKKYFCKYCNIYIADDAPSRRQHEGGLRHKGNVERFVRDLYKTGEKRKHDLEEEKREMARIEKAANAAFAQDVGSGLVKPGSSSRLEPSKEAGPSKPVQKTDLYANYSTAASLGYTDPDEARLKAEQERRSKEGVVGTWEVVTVAEPGSSSLEVAAEEQKPGLAAVQEESGRKREAEAQPDDEDTRQFKLRKKKLGVGLGELYDPGVIPIKLKKKEEPVADSAEGNLQPASTSSALDSSTSKATAVPKWTSRGWAKHGAGNSNEDATDTSTMVDTDASAIVKANTDASVTAAVSSPPNPQEDEDVKVKVEGTQDTLKSEDIKSSAALPPTSGSLFKKRKVPVGGAGSRSRRE